MNFNRTCISIYSMKYKNYMNLFTRKFYIVKGTLLFQSAYQSFNAVHINTMYLKMSNFINLLNQETDADNDFDDKVTEKALPILRIVHLNMNNGRMR